MGTLFQMSHITFVFDMFRSAFDGIEYFVLAYLICVIIFFIIGKEFLNVAFVYPLAFMAVTIFNPFLIVPVSELIGLTTRFRRLFWLLPVNLVLAYAFTFLCTIPPRISYLTNPPHSTKRQIHLNLLRKATAAVCCIIFIVQCGTFVKPHFQTPENIYKTTGQVLEISRIIQEDSDQTGLEKIALYSSQQLLELRQYDPSIRSILRRNDLLDWELPDKEPDTVESVIRTGHRLHILALVSRYQVQIDQEIFRENAEKCNANYIITHRDDGLHSYLTDAGYLQIGTAEEFEIYRISL